MHLSAMNMLPQVASDPCSPVLQVKDGTVHSLHETTTGTHVQKATQMEPCVARTEVLAEMRLNLSATYAFQKQRSTDIALDLWRIALH